jgi:ribosome-dependent ATPase
MTPSDPFVASVHEVGLRYRGKIALDRVTLAIPTGKRIALIGLDGVVKSSLLSLLAGSRRIQTGRVEVLDER